MAVRNAVLSFLKTNAIIATAGGVGILLGAAFQYDIVRNAPRMTEGEETTVFDATSEMYARDFGRHTTSDPVLKTLRSLGINLTTEQYDQLKREADTNYDGVVSQMRSSPTSANGSMKKDAALL